MECRSTPTPITGQRVMNNQSQPIGIKRFFDILRKSWLSLRKIRVEIIQSNYLHLKLQLPCKPLPESTSAAAT
jgi:hypothetical protein